MRSDSIAVLHLGNMVLKAAGLLSPAEKTFSQVLPLGPVFL